MEVQEAAEVIEDILDEDVKMIWGMTFDESYEDEIKVTIIATGFDVVDDTSYASATRAKSRKLNAADSFVTRSVKTEQPSQEQKPRSSDDLDTPAFIRRKI
jgi:cell division protein FtsZ